MKELGYALAGLLAFAIRLAVGVGRRVKGERG